MMMEIQDFEIEPIQIEVINLNVLTIKSDLKLSKCR